LGYAAGITATIVVMNWFQAAQVSPVTNISCHHLLLSEQNINTYFSLSFVFDTQPALLYIVPGVTGFVAAHSLWNGEVKPVSFLPCALL
jgi:minor histocompatibility antigen H13